MVEKNNQVKAYYHSICGSLLSYGSKKAINPLPITVEELYCSKCKDYIDRDSEEIIEGRMSLEDTLRFTHGKDIDNLAVRNNKKPVNNRESISLDVKYHKNKPIPDGLGTQSLPSHYVDLEIYVDEIVDEVSSGKEKSIISMVYDKLKDQGLSWITIENKKELIDRLYSKLKDNKDINLEIRGK